MKYLIPLAALTVVIAILLTACGDNATPTSRPAITKPPGAATAAPTESAQHAGQRTPLTAGNSAFALDLYHRLAAEAQGNLVYSPHSISMALAMAYAGARSETQAQMADVLHFTLPQEQLHSAFGALHQRLTTPVEEVDEDAFKLNIANSVWGQENHPFRKEYLDILRNSYGEEVRQTDFASKPYEARVSINEWVAQETGDRIKDLIPMEAISIYTRLVLANAIYLDAKWLNNFHEMDTSGMPFHPTPKTTVNVPTMRQQEDMGYMQGNGFQAVQLAYEGESASMIILVPDEGRYSEVERNLTTAIIYELTERMEQTEVELLLPKFDMEYDVSLPDALAAMGMADAFSDTEADFSGMDGNSCGQAGDLCLYVNAVVHKAFIKVDEEGTEAAAATAVVVQQRSLPPEPDVRLHVDRPFIFLVREASTGAILFVGRVTNPED